MRILNKNKNEVKVEITSKDDLWYLTQVIDPGDLVSGKTERKIQVAENERAKKTKRKVIFIEIRVEKVEFEKTTASLRVLGTITVAPDDIPHGEHHSFSLDEGSKITIKKEIFYDFQLQKLKEASRESKSRILICVFDRETAFFALLKNYGYVKLASINGEVQKKYVEQQSKNFYTTIIKQLKDYEARFSLDKIILASPAFWKEELAKELTDDNLKKKVVFATSSSATENAISEVMKRDELKTVLKEQQFSTETNLVEELFAEISKQGPASYGIDDVKQAAESGAVRDLLIVDSLIQEARQNNSFDLLDFIMKTVDKNKGRIHLISTEHEAGKRLVGLAGIAAILRYKVS